MKHPLRRLAMLLNSMLDKALPPPDSAIPRMLDKALPPPRMMVPYKYLTADECEALKRNVHFDHWWASYGPNREHPLQWSLISELETSHLENILITQPQVPNEVAAAMIMLLKQRYQESR